MSQETCSAASPFSALTYQEQQDRWLEWRSRQLDYRPANAGMSRESSAADPAANQKRTADSAVPELPQVRLTNMALNAPRGRKELDQVLSRHARAARRAGAFQTAPIG